MSLKHRWTVNMQAVAWIGNQPQTCAVLDISIGGARIQLANSVEIAIGKRIQLGLYDLPPIPAEVRYNEDGALGLMLLHDKEGEDKLGSYLMSQRPPRRDPRKKLDVEATLRPLRNESTCVVRDISRMGANVMLSDTSQLSKDDDVILSIKGYGNIAAKVRRIADGEVGLMFQQAIVGELPRRR